MATKPPHVDRGTVSRWSHCFGSPSVSAGCRLYLTVSRDSASCVGCERRVLHRPGNQQLRRGWHVYATPLPDRSPAARDGFVLHAALLLVTVGEPTSRMGRQPHCWHIARPQI